MKIATALMAAVLTVGLVTSLDAEAKRLGGGKSSGMQRQQVTQPAPQQGGAAGNPGAPTQAGVPAAAAAPAAAGAAAGAAKRSWMGPIAGLAAGLGLAALASHLGLGEAFGNILMMILLGVAVMAIIGFVMRKRAAASLQGAGAGMGGLGNLGGNAPNGMARSSLPTGNGRSPGLGIGSALTGSVAAPVAGTIPADFDAPAFARTAKSQFMALQSANDAGDLDRLRDFLTPEMFDLAAAEVRERNGATQATEVFGLEAQVVEVVEDAQSYVVSVRFTGSTRDQAGAAPDELDEIWHLTKPRAGFGGWVIAGIQQLSAELHERPMRTATWIGTALLALLWTGGAWLTAEFLQWGASALAAGGGISAVGDMTAPGLPAWLVALFGPEVLEMLQGLVEWGKGPLASALPFAGSAVAWLVPLVWVTWALGLLALLAMATGAHLLINRFARRPLPRFQGA